MNQAEILETLDTEYDVQDVYFHKETLYIVNSYDVPSIEQFKTDHSVDVKTHVVDDMYVPDVS